MYIKLVGVYIICSAHFSNLRNLQIAQRNLKIANLPTHFEFAAQIVNLRNAFAHFLDCATGTRAHLVQLNL